MSSPFPGMDRYLEGSEWHSVHAELSTELARQLGPKLRPKYIARTVRRFVMDIPGHQRYRWPRMRPFGLMISSKKPVSDMLHK
jgi:hypothetical protein